MEEKVRLILGKLNSSTMVRYWKLGEYIAYENDYAVVENQDGFDLVRIVGIIEVTERNASLISNTIFKHIKNVRYIIPKNDLIEDTIINVPSNNQTQ